MSDVIISAQSLCKTYVSTVRKSGLKGAVSALFRAEKKAIDAVRDVSFALHPGEVVGYIGPNGAGKSTTIKMLVGILTPSAGSVSVCGLNPQKNRIENAKNIGVVFGQRTQLWWDLPVGETFELVRRMYEIEEAPFKKNLAEFNEVLELEPFMKRPVRQLSLGQRMRAEIAAALLHNPRVLFLDEPTIGLDVAVKHRMREFIRRVNRERGVTILLTTHDLQDIEQLARRIIVINHGRMGFDGTLEDMAARAGMRRTLRLTFDEPQSSLDLSGLEDQAEATVAGLTADIKFDPALPAADLIARVMRQCPVRDIDIQGPLIDDIVMSVYGDRHDP